MGSRCWKVTCGLGLLPVLQVLECGLSQGGYGPHFWSPPGWELLVRGGGRLFVVLGPYYLCTHFSQFWTCCSSTCALSVWKEVGSWVLLCFNHLMTLCPVQYQFVKVSGALHKIKSFDTLHPSSKCNKNILADLSQWHSAGENLSRGVWPSVLEMHIKIIPSCCMVLLDSLKFQLDGCHLRALWWMNGCKLQLVLRWSLMSESRDSSVFFPQPSLTSWKWLSSAETFIPSVVWCDSSCSFPEV